MKPIKSLLVLALVLPLAPTDAFGQPGGYYSQPPPNSQLPGGFHNRTGRLIFGFNLGLGSMEDNGGDIECSNCSALAGQAAGHIGGFVGPRLALMGELHGNVQTLSDDAFEGTSQLVQSALMVAAQYWVTPQLWIKGGIGFANLQVDYSYYGDGIIDASSQPENGLAIMGAVGFELFSARYFSVDVQGRLVNGSYDSIDYQVTGGSIGVGVNWF